VNYAVAGPGVRDRQQSRVDRRSLKKRHRKFQDASHGTSTLKLPKFLVTIYLCNIYSNEQ
jgi:hypothetical protein